MNNGTNVADRIDAMPVIDVAQQSQWSVAEATRDAFGEEIQSVLDECKVLGLVENSQPGMFPVWVSLIVWQREDDLIDSTRFRRQDFSVSIDVNSYLRHPMIMTVKVTANGRKYGTTTWDVDRNDIRALALWVLDRGEKPALFNSNILEKALLAIPAMFGLYHGKNDNPLVDYAKPPLLTGPKVLAVLGVILALIGMGFPFLILVGLAMIVAAATMVSRRKVTDSVMKRPERSPRRLFLVDSWHASIPDVRDRFEELRGRIAKRLSVFDAEIVQHWETHSTRTAYRVVRQERLVLTKGQAVVHVHIYPVADQAFVGWDGYINWACWAESKPVSVTVDGGSQVNYRNLVIADYMPTAFDLVEFNVLSEMVHGQIVAELRSFIKEKAIEADIDFSIIRGDRDTALTVGDKRNEVGRRRTGMKAA